MLSVKCVKITAAVIPFLILFILAPIILKVSRESSRPLICYKCWADKSIQGEGEGAVWDRPWCLLDQTYPDAMAETVVCQPSETVIFYSFTSVKIYLKKIAECLSVTQYCGIYYHEKQDHDGGGASAIFVRGCQEDRQRPSLFIGNFPSIVYGKPTGRNVVVEDPLRNTNHTYWAFDQACSTPLCNSWVDYTQTWGWIDWFKEAYTFHCPGLPARIVTTSETESV